MEMLDQFFSEAFIHALGWTVLHSLWQAVLVALLLGLLNVFLQRQPSHVRYLAGNLGLLFVLIMALLTFTGIYSDLLQTEAADAAIVTIALSSFQETSAEASQGISYYFHQFGAYFNQHLPLIVTAWLMGAALFALRLLGGLAYVRHIRERGVYPVEGYWKQRMSELTRQLGIRSRVRLLESTLAKAPMVAGHFKPVILLPIGALNALTPDQVEAILAHELAHIARRDYLFNLLQSMVEVLFYFNPGVWWISAFIRNERENCCDDIAVSVCGDSLTYARALMSLQELCQASPTLALALAGNKNQLVNRIRRLLNQPERHAYLTERIAATLMLMMVIFLVPLITTGRTNTADVIVEIPSSVEEKAHVVRMEPLESLPVLALDTLPREETTLEVVKGDGQHLKVRIKEGEIQELELDGEKIPASEFAEYENMVEEYLDFSDPPAPPAPPAPPVPPAPNVTPAPPTPPAPPAPPALPEIWVSGERVKMIQKTQENGKVKIYIKTEDGEMKEFDAPQGGTFFFDDSFLSELEAIPGDFEWKMEDMHLLEERLMEQNELLEDMQIHFKELGDSIAFKLKPLKEGDFKIVVPGGTWTFDSLHLNHNFNDNGDNFSFFNSLSSDEDIFRLKDGNKTSFRVTGGEGFFDSTVQNRLEKALREDDLMDQSGGYRLELSKKEMIVNGVRQPSSVAKKYREIYQEATGIELGASTKIVVERKAPM